MKLHFLSLIIGAATLAGVVTGCDGMRAQLEPVSVSQNENKAEPEVSALEQQGEILQGQKSAQALVEELNQMKEQFAQLRESETLSKIFIPNYDDSKMNPVEAPKWSQFSFVTAQVSPINKMRSLLTALAYQTVMGSENYLTEERLSQLAGIQGRLWTLSPEQWLEKPEGYQGGILTSGFLQKIQGEPVEGALNLGPEDAQKIQSLTVAESRLLMVLFIDMLSAYLAQPESSMVALTDQENSVVLGQVFLGEQTSPLIEQYFKGGEQNSLLQAFEVIVAQHPDAVVRTYGQLSQGQIFKNKLYASTDIDGPLSLSNNIQCALNKSLVSAQTEQNVNECMQLLPLAQFDDLKALVEAVSYNFKVDAYMAILPLTIKNSILDALVEATEENKLNDKAYTQLLQMSLVLAMPQLGQASGQQGNVLSQLGDGFTNFTATGLHYFLKSFLVGVMSVEDLQRRALFLASDDSRAYLSQLSSALKLTAYQTTPELLADLRVLNAVVEEIVNSEAGKLAEIQAQVTDLVKYLVENKQKYDATLKEQVTLQNNTESVPSTPLQAIDNADAQLLVLESELQALKKEVDLKITDINSQFVGQISGASAQEAVDRRNQLIRQSELIDLLIRIIQTDSAEVTRKTDSALATSLVELIASKKSLVTLLSDVDETEERVVQNVSDLNTQAENLVKLKQEFFEKTRSLL